MFREFLDLGHARSFRKTILPLSIVFFVYTFGWGLTSSMFSIFINNSVKSLFLTGIILSLTTLMGVFLNLPFGIIESKLNIKRVLQITLLAYAVIAILYSVSNSFVALLSISIFRGIASSFLWLTSWAYVFNYSSRKIRGKETGFFSDMNDMASAIAPILGGFSVLLFFVLPFYLLSVTSFISFILVSVFIKEVPKRSKTNIRSQFRLIKKYFRNMRFIKTISSVVIFYALINVYYSFISIFLNNKGLSIPIIGTLLTISLFFAVALEVPIGNFIDTHGVRKTLMVAAAVAASAGIAMVFLNALVYLIPVITIFSIAYTMIFIALYSRMSDIMLKDKTQMTGAIATFKDLGYTIGPLVTGFVMVFLGVNTTFLLTGISFVALIPIAYTLND